MKSGPHSAQRFVRAIRFAMEWLAGEAKCFCYQYDVEYLELKEDMKFCIRMLENDENFAGKLLYKNARKISHKTAMGLIEKARTEEERKFWTCVAELNHDR